LAAWVRAFDGRSASCLEHTQHLDRTITRFRLGGRCSSLHRARSCLGINRIGLAAAAAILALGPLNF
jgi:hypothetical protein